MDPVNWSRLTDAYGTAEHVPEDIRALTAPEAPAQQEALSRLEATLCHDGYRYPASAPAVPLLFEALQSPGTTLRSAIIGLLVQLAVGYPEKHLARGFDPQKEFRAVEKLARKADLDAARAAPPPPDEEPDAGLIALWERDAYEAVARGVEVFRQLARDEGETVRRSAVRALAWFPGEALDSARLVRTVAGEVTSPGERANAILCLGLLGRSLQDLSDVPVLKKSLVPAQPVPVRLAAALSLGVVLADRLPDDALALLLEAVEGRMGDGPLDGLEGWHISGPVAHAADLLAAIRPKPSGPLVSAMCRAAASNDTGSRPHVWVALLSLVFRKPKRVKWVPDRAQPLGLRAEYLDPLKLTANQLRALQAIGSNPLWERMNPLCDQHMDICEAFGLPRHRETLWGLLTEAAEQRR